jgi:hypothetical protein
MKLQEFEALAREEGFRAFTVYTKGGLKAEVPHPEFVSIPPGEEPSYVLVYFLVNKIAVPRFIDLDAIDHIDFSL